MNTRDHGRTHTDTFSLSNHKNAPHAKALMCNLGKLYMLPREKNIIKHDL